MSDDAKYREVLKPSPNFSLELDFTGKPYLASSVYPYNRAINLSEPHRLLLACFGGEGTSVRDALRAFLRANALAWTAAYRQAAYELVAGLKQSRILIPSDDSDSMYGAEMARDYLEQRTIPPEIARWIVRAARIERRTHVLDLATGTGALANQLAAASSHVTGMDVSSTFLRLAAEDAADRGVQVRYLHDNCNRLVYHRERYDVVTISLAFHWLDPGVASRGIHAVLKPGGRLVVIYGFLSLPKRHPLEPLLAKVNNGAPPPNANRLARAHEAQLAALGCDVRLKSTHAITEQRPIGIAYARAFFSSELLRAAQISNWRDPSRLWRRMERHHRARKGVDWIGRFLWRCVVFERRA